MSLCLLAASLVALAAATPARAGELQRDRAEARELARQIGELDGRIEIAVRACARATSGLTAVRAEMRQTRRSLRVARLQLDIARGALVRRAVALYKHADATALDALLSAGDFQQLVDQLSLARRVTQSDRQMLRVVIDSRRELQKRGALLAANERTAERLVRQRSSELESIRAELTEREQLLSGVEADIARLAARTVRADSPSSATVEPPPADDDGQGAWWPLIKSAAASQGVSARGMYRLMMIESGGSAGIVGPGGFHGLFQYARTTWNGSWNPYRAAGIYDGAAQIRATALAVRLGYGSSWWGESYAWAFGT